MGPYYLLATSGCQVACGENHMENICRIPLLNLKERKITTTENCKFYAQGTIIKVNLQINYMQNPQHITTVPILFFVLFVHVIPDERHWFSSGKIWF